MGLCMKECCFIYSQTFLNFAEISNAADENLASPKSSKSDGSANIHGYGFKYT